MTNAALFEHIAMSGSTAIIFFTRATSSLLAARCEVCGSDTDKEVEPALLLPSAAL